LDRFGLIARRELAFDVRNFAGRDAARVSDVVGAILEGTDSMWKVTVAMALLIGLGGCGQHEPDRATGGAATGAGTGAVIGLVGGPVGVVVGALIGGGVGAVTGAAVPPKHVDLGPPPWSGQSH